MGGMARGEQTTAGHFKESVTDSVKGEIQDLKVFVGDMERLQTFARERNIVPEERMIKLKEVEALSPVFVEREQTKNDVEKEALERKATSSKDAKLYYGESEDS